MVQSVWSVFSPWIPLMLVIAFWIFFLVSFKGTKYGRLIERNFEHMDRVESLLEHILDELRRQPRA